MKFALGIVGLTLFSQLSFAVGVAPQSKAEYCQGRQNSQYFRSLAFNTSNHLTFANRGGLLNGGVCWWHNLFQRSALYLSVFRPELPRPTKSEAKQIIHAIAAGSRVVQIPGYKNLGEFSRDWENEIQSQLEAWQREDGFLKFAWIQGLSGNYQTSANLIEKTWTTVLGHNSTGQIEWTMWQLKGISSHASLDVGGKAAGKHFEISHIDSNFPSEVRTLTWEPPAASVDSYAGPFTPYIHRRSDFSYFEKAAKQFCSSRGDNVIFDFGNDQLRNDID